MFYQSACVCICGQVVKSLSQKVSASIPDALDAIAELGLHKAEMSRSSGIDLRVLAPYIYKKSFVYRYIILGIRFYIPLFGMVW